MKIEINKYVAPEFYSSNFPGRNLAPDIAGFVNLFCLQIEKVSEFRMPGEEISPKREIRGEFLNYITEKFRKLSENLGWIFDSGWEFYVIYPLDKKTIEIGYEDLFPENRDSGTNLFNIHIEFLD